MHEQGQCNNCLGQERPNFVPKYHCCILPINIFQLIFGWNLCKMPQNHSHYGHGIQNKQNEKKSFIDVAGF